MDGIGTYMMRDHKACDEYFAQADDAATAGDWARVTRSLAVFVAALERHFELEEQILFPAFEERTGMSAGPTQMMRSEHEDMRALLADLQRAALEGDVERYSGLAETLLLMSQQHNLKEEQILYPMMDRTLAAEEQALLARLEAWEAA
ncbi:MAG: hemerythrin domain-containing protein [Burkholderiales bacterium]